MHNLSINDVGAFITHFMTQSTNLIHQQTPPPIVHGFFKGVVSIPNLQPTAFNCSLGKGEDERVMLNRHVMKKALLSHKANLSTHIEDIPLLFLKQVHGNVVVTVDSPFDTILEADAMVTSQTNILLGVQTADCIPLLFADPCNSVIGVAHAGWKGLKQGVIQNTLAAMEQLGANRSKIRAAIGPCIAPQSYEVGEDVFENFKENYPSVFYPWPTPHTHDAITPTPKTYAFDIAKVATQILKAEKIMDISHQMIDTYSQLDYFSFRRHTHQNIGHIGNQASVIGMLSF